MNSTSTPRWLQLLEKTFGWLAIPNIAILLCTTQAAGFLFVSLDPLWFERLALVPALVSQHGEYWRLITFLALPLSLSPIFIIFTLWFLYYILNAIESRWGSFKTTLYVLVSIALTIAFSFVFNYPITQVSHFESTLFLAGATLFPEMEIRLFMAIPVKMKWMAFITGAFVFWEFAQGSWHGRLLLVAIYSNYLLFFGPALFNSIKFAVRRWQFRRRL